MNIKKNILTIGLTGGIGVGKSYCALIFQEIGIPIYNSDHRAKQLMTSSPEVINKIKTVFGSQAYTEKGLLNRSFLADKIFKDKQLRNTINEIVHPVVRKDFLTWVETQKNTSYVLQESALLFEIGLYKKFDAMILVDAPLELRISRVMSRDKVDRNHVLQRINSQMSSEEKRQMADYIIDNDGTQGVIKQILKIHYQLIESGITGSALYFRS